MLILLVEDDAVLSFVMTMDLSDAKHEVLGPVSTMAESLALAEETAPGLALVDIVLHDESSGIELARELKRRCQVPSLFICGHYEQARANKDVALGLISKPFISDTVLRSIVVADHIIAQRPPPRPAVPEGLELFEG